MSSSPKPAWLTCEVTTGRLSEVDAIIPQLLNVRGSEFQKVVSQLITRQGKKIRPTLFLLAATFGEDYDKGFLRIAAAMELLHVASLYHDDVIDSNDFRRSEPTVNKVWGNSNAALAGNYLFSRAMSTLDETDTPINQFVCRYISALCLGQLKEVENAYNVEAGIEWYMEVITGKTASLLELPCLLGSTLSNANPSLVAVLEAFSRELGIAFQLIDDLIDIVGDPATTGKPRGTDLREGVYTYPTLHALHHPLHGSKLKEMLLMESLSDGNISECIKLIQLSGGVDAVKAKAAMHAQAAREAILMLPDTPARSTLMNIIAFVTSRDH